MMAPPRRRTLFTERRSGRSLMSLASTPSYWSPKNTSVRQWGSRAVPSERCEMGITNCRSCGGNDLRVILDLGSQPIANALLRAEELSRPEARYPLMLAFCRACALLQVTET